jgi:hypothetical protein
MSDTGELTSVSEQAPSATGELPAAQPSSGVGVAQASQGGLQEAPGKAQGSGEVPPAAQTKLEFENLQLLSRFLLGALLMGGGSFTEIMRGVQREIEAQPQPSVQDPNAEDESLRDLLRYLSIGLVVRGQKRAVGLVQGGFRLSLDVTRRLVGGADRATDNRLARPFRRAMVSRLQRLEREAEHVIDEGRLEEYNAKLLAGETIDDLIDQVVDQLAESPELTDMIIELVGQQGKGMASIAGDNARSLSVIADNVTERLVRRLLRRKPRQELPPSPVYGVPQTMYSTDKVAGGIHEPEQ